MQHPVSNALRRLMHGVAMLRLRSGSDKLSEYLISRACIGITTNESQNWGVGIIMNRVSEAQALITADRNGNSAATVLGYSDTLKH